MNIVFHYNTRITNKLLFIELDNVQYYIILIFKNLRIDQVINQIDFNN